MALHAEEESNSQRLLAECRTPSFVSILCCSWWTYKLNRLNQQSFEVQLSPRHQAPGPHRTGAKTTQTPSDSIPHWPARKRQDGRSPPRTERSPALCKQRRHVHSPRRYSWIRDTMIVTEPSTLRYPDSNHQVTTRIPEESTTMSQ